LEFRESLLTSEIQTSYRVVSVILGLAILVEHQLVTDGQTRWRASI